jgi:hypothetical protein
MNTNNRWKSLSILDLLLLCPAYAFGAGLFRDTSATPRWTNFIAELLVCLFAGTLIAAPITFISQWIRGRREGFSMGEGLWAMQFGVYATLYLLLHCNVTIEAVPFLVAFGGWMFLQFLFGSVAFVFHLFGRWQETGTRWTDLIGCVSNILHPFILLYILQHDLTMMD